MLIEKEEEYGKKYRQPLKIGWKILQNINREVTISIMFFKKYISEISIWTCKTG